MSNQLTFNVNVDTNKAVQEINSFFQSVDKGAAQASSKLNTAFNQTLTTEVEVVFKNGELVARKIEKSNTASKKLKDTYRAVNGEIAKTPNGLKKQISILKQLQGNTQKYKNGTNQVTQEWKKLTTKIKDAERAQRKMSGKNFFSGVTARFAAASVGANLFVGALGNVGRAVGQLATEGMELEVLGLQLQAFTGSSEAAEAAFKQFADIAAKTPFDLKQVAEAGKIMMAFGIDTDTAIESTEQLGIVASATGGDLNLLARNLGQIAAQGQAYTRDLTQFAIQGIPIWKQLSYVTGETVTQLKKMASEGKIGFAEVQAAIRNMTKDGSAFAELSKRMQETFTGRLAKIASDFQQLARAVVTTFNDVDQALGGILANSMKLLGDAMVFLADNMDKIASALVGIIAGFAAFFALAKFGAIVSGIQAVVTGFTSMSTILTTVNSLKSFFVSLTPGGMLRVAAAVGTAALVYKTMSDRIGEARDKMEDLKVEAGASSEVIDGMTDKQVEAIAKTDEQFQAMLDQYEGLKKKADERKADLDAEVAQLKQMKKDIKEKADAEIADIQRVIDKERDKLEEMKSIHKQQMTDMEDRHRKALELIDIEINGLREKGDAEQALYDFQKQALIQKIRSGTLDEEQLLTAKARLERMERQEKIEKLIAEKVAKKKQNEAEITDLKDKQLDAEEKLSDSIEDNEDKVENIKDTTDQQIKLIDQAIKEVDKMTGAVDSTNTSVDAQIGLVKTLAGEYAQAAAQADALKTKLNQAATAQRNLNAARRQAAQDAAQPASSGDPFDFRDTDDGLWTGGPVSGGSTYTVNELGKEAFLSASGKLSMINAPAFGKWRAPGKGTVIPAHLTKQLDIPSGGVNINSGAAAQASRAGASGGNGAIVRALSAMSGGDTISNQVTIQAQNPVQASNSVMVQLAKLKRIRYS